MPTDRAAHWQRTYSERAEEEMSWTEAIPATSLEMIALAAPPRSAAILDVGGGTSALAGKLLKAGYTDITVADISGAAIERARAALGAEADRILWVQADVRTHEFGRRFDLWHDRAVFHFMVEPGDRDAYLAALDRSLHPGGHLVLATFGPEGPAECSGLPVVRYDPEAICSLLEYGYRPLSSRLVDHRTPSGTTQQFTYVLLRREVQPN